MTTFSTVWTNENGERVGSSVSGRKFLLRDVTAVEAHDRVRNVTVVKVPGCHDFIVNGTVEEWRGRIFSTQVEADYNI